jgi:hypothetical protein
MNLTQQFVLCPAQVVEDVLKEVFKIKREEVLQMVWTVFLNHLYLVTTVLANPVCEGVYFPNYG